MLRKSSKLILYLLEQKNKTNEKKYNFSRNASYIFRRDISKFASLK